MNIRQDTIQHIFRNKYIKNSSGLGTTINNNSTNDERLDKWFYEDDNGSLHSKLNFVSDLGLTAYAQGERTTATIMDGVVCDETTITKEDGKLKVIGGTGGSGGVSSWDDLTDKPDWITDEKPIYTWSEITNKPSTISGYNISDAVTTNTEQTISGQKTFEKTIYQGTSLANRRAISYVDTSNNAIFADVNGRTIIRGNLLSLQLENGKDKVKINNDGLFVDNNIVYNSGNDGENSGLDADLLDGKHYSDIINGNVLSATKLQNKRTLWGQEFDGTTDVSGNMTGVGSITANGNISTSSDIYINSIHLYKSEDGFLCIDGDLAVTGGITAYAQGERTTSTIMDAIICDETTITKQNNKLTVIGGVGGVSSWDDLTDKPSWITDSKPTYSWSEITSKPTEFAPSSHTHSISNITNLQTTLDAKANSSHTHTWSSITNKPSTFTPSSHTHSISNITNLQTTLNGKANSSHTHTWSEITNKPTTISGYNITDAVTTNTLQDIEGQKTFKDVIYQTYNYNDYKRAISYVDANKNLIFGDTNANTFLRGKQIKIQNENGVDTILISNTQVSFNQPINCNADHITTTGWFQNSTAGKGLYNVEGEAKFYFEKTFGGWKADKSILTTGGITCYGSDKRAKDIIEDISLSLSDIADAPTIRFKWNDWKIKDDGKTHIGGIAQYTQNILPEAVIESEEMLNMDYATTAYIFAVQTAKHLQSINNKLLSKIEELEKKIIDLNKHLSDEKTNTMVN